MNDHSFTWILLLALCLNHSANAASDPIEYAKHIDVAVLDKSISSQRLDDWLRSEIGADASLRWRTTQCLNTATCVVCDIIDSGGDVSIIVRVGTNRRPISGTPRVIALESPTNLNEHVKLSEVTEVLGRGRRVVDYAKAIDVHQLDSTLASERLDDWLRVGPLKMAGIQWKISDCNIKPVDQDRASYPLCVTFSFEREAVRAVGFLRVGTLGQPISSRPSLLQGIIQSGSGPHSDVKVTSRLSEMSVAVTEFERQRSPKK